MQPKPPIGPTGRLLLGLAFVAGATGLASLAAPSTMTLTRTGPKTVTVTVETRLFNLYRIGGFRIDGAESVEVVGNYIPPTGTGPDINAITIYYVTRDGRNYRWRQELFDGYVWEIQAFFAGDTASTTLSVNDSGSGFGRFIIVHLIVSLMLLVGILTTWASVTALLRRDQKIRA